MSAPSEQLSLVQPAAPASAGARLRPSRWLMLRYGVLIFLPLMLMLLARVLMLYHEARDHLEQGRLQGQQGVVAQVQNEVKQSLSWSVRDVRFLTELGPAQGLEAFAAQMQTLMNTRLDQYDQIRWIDESGRERIRVDQVRAQAYRVAVADLQDKSDRYYVRQGLGLKPGQVYVSPLDLNVELAQVELPHKPMLRLVSRIFDAQGSPQGLVVINVLASPMLERMRHLPPTDGTHVWLLNAAGYWLLGDQPADEWGFMFADRAEVSAAQRFPALWRAVNASSEAGSATDTASLGLLTHARLELVSLLAMPQLDLQPDPQTNWRLVVWLPAAQWRAQLQVLVQQYLINGAELTLVFLLFSALAAVLIFRRRLNLDTLRQRQAQISDLLQGSPDALVVADERGRVVVVNERAESMFGESRGALLGRQVAGMFTGGQAGAPGPAGNPMWPDPQNPGLQVLAKNGQRVPVSLSLNEVGTVEGPRTIGTLRDISDEQANARALSQANQSLLGSNRELAVANLELESFVSSVSHDLRSHLRAIQGFSQILLSEHAGQLDDAGQALLRRSVSASQRMSALIEDLLALSRVSRAELELRDVDLSAMAQEIVQELRTQDPERRVDVQIAPELHARADAGLIRVALSNLLSNAWKFTSKVDQARIEFGIDASGAAPVYYLSDNGAGFDMADADKLFLAFQRLHDQKDFPGTGVGLATVMRVIVRHGGTIEALGKPGEGAQFRFTLGI